MGLHDTVISMLTRWASVAQEFPHDPSRPRHKEIDEMLAESLKDLEATTIDLEVFVESERKRMEKKNGE